MKLFANMDGNQLNMTVWASVITGAVLLVSMLLIGSSVRDARIAELLRDGHDPIELACLYKRSADIAPACLLLIERRTP